MLSSRHSY